MTTRRSFRFKPGQMTTTTPTRTSSLTSRLDPTPTRATWNSNDPTGEGFITPYQTPTFSIERASADEGRAITVNVHRAGDLSGESFVEYRTVDLATANRPATGGYPQAACRLIATTTPPTELWIFGRERSPRIVHGPNSRRRHHGGRKPQRKIRSRTVRAHKRHPNHGYSAADHQRRLHRPLPTPTRSRRRSLASTRPSTKAKG